MNPQKLSAKVIKLIEDQKRYEELIVSAISPWEFSKLLSLMIRKTIEKPGVVYKRFLSRKIYAWVRAQP